MGASSTSIRVERLDDSGDEDDRGPLAAALWEAIAARLFALAPDDWGKLEYFASEVAEEALEEGEWTQDEETIDLIFGHLGGACSSSADLLVHQIEQLLAREGATLDQTIAQPLGWRLVLEPGDAFAEARHRATPQLFVDGKLYDLSTLAIGESLKVTWYYGCDSGGSRPFESLSAEDQQRVTRTAITGQCRCQLCELERGTLESLDPAREADLLATFTRLATDAEGQRLCHAAGEAVRAYSAAAWHANPAGPAELVALSQHLAAHGLRPTPYALSGLVTSSEPQC